MSTEVRSHHQEPVHSLRQRGVQFGSLPFREGAKDGVRRTCDEVDLAGAQRLAGFVVREDELVRDIKSFPREEAELDRSDRRKVRV